MPKHPRVPLPECMAAAPKWQPPAHIDSITAPPGLVAKIRAVRGLASIRVMLRVYPEDSRPLANTVQMFKLHNPEPGVAPPVPAERLAAYAWYRAQEVIAEHPKDYDGEVEVEIVALSAFTPPDRKTKTKRRYTHSLHGPTTRRQLLGLEDEDPEEDEDLDDSDEDEAGDDDADDDEDDEDEDEDEDDDDDDAVWAGPGWHEPGVNPIQHGPRREPAPPPRPQPQPPQYPAPYAHPQHMQPASPYGPPAHPYPQPQPAPYGYPVQTIQQVPPPPAQRTYNERGQDLFLDHLGGVFAETRATIRELNAHLGQAKANEQRMMQEVMNMSRLSGEQYKNMLQASTTGWNALHQGMSMQMSALQNTMQWKEQINEKESRIKQLEAAEQRGPKGPPAWMQLVSTLAPLGLAAANTITHVVTKQPGPPPPMITPEVMQAMGGAMQGGAPPGMAAAGPAGFQAEPAAPAGFAGTAEPAGFAGSSDAPGAAFEGFGQPAGGGEPVNVGGFTGFGQPEGPQDDESARAQARAYFDSAPTSAMADSLVKITPERAVAELRASGLGHVWDALRGLVGAPSDDAIADQARAAAQLLDDGTAERVANALPSVDADGNEHTSPRRLFHDLRSQMVTAFPASGPDLWAGSADSGFGPGPGWGTAPSAPVPPPDHRPHPYPSTGEPFVAGPASAPREVIDVEVAAPTGVPSGMSAADLAAPRVKRSGRRKKKRKR